MAFHALTGRHMAIAAFRINITSISHSSQLESVRAAGEHLALTHPLDIQSISIRMLPVPADVKLHEVEIK